MNIFKDIIAVRVFIINRAKEIVQRGFVWANWSLEQAEAFRELILETEKVEQLKRENDELRNRISEKLEVKDE